MEMVREALIPVESLVRRADARVRAPDVPRRGRPPSTAMTLTQAKLIAGSLGVPSKMPGYSYGLDAFRCITGSKMAEVPGSICSVCFARKNYYATWRPAIIARDRRHEGIRRPQWVEAMTLLINHYCQPPNDYFRWHDSGDLQGVWHLARIVEVCRRTPTIKHWLPTREYRMVAEYLWDGGDVPDNLTIRLSALLIDTECVIPPELAEALARFPLATTHTPGAGKVVEGKGSIECRAIEVRDNQCGPCRACWSDDVRCVSYPQH